MIKMIRNILFSIFILTIFISLTVYGQRKVLLEEFTGTWCGWCPYGADIIKQILTERNDVVVLAYHDSDPMSTSDGNQLINIMQPAYPQAAIDRIHFSGQDKIPISRGFWSSRCAERAQIIPTFSILLEAGYNSSTRNVNLNVNLKTLADLSGTYRINVVISEDSLNYTQKIYEKPYDEISPYYHMHVVREMITGTFGEVLNASPLVNNTSIQKNYNFSLNSNYNDRLCHIVVFVHEDLGNGIGPVQQAEETDLSLTTGIKEEYDDLFQPDNFKLFQNYPNPFNSETIINYQLPFDCYVVLKIYNILGREVKTLVNENKTAGYYSVKWDGTNTSGIKVSSGIYLYKIKTKDFIEKKKLIMLQ